MQKMHEGSIRSLRQIGTSLFELVLDAPELARSLKPGQFMQIAVPGDGSHLLRIPLSYSATDVNLGYVTLIFDVVGEGTRRLSMQKEHTRLSVIGPLGNGWPRVSNVQGQAGMVGQAHPSVLLVGGGVGAPPVLAYASHLKDEGAFVQLILGAKTRDMLVPHTQVAARVNKVQVATDDGSYGVQGYPVPLVEEALKERKWDMVCTCGPTPLMAAVARLCKDAGVPAYTSLEAYMGCGFGACSGCAVPLAAGGYALCCTDGPVFDAQKVRWS